MKLIERTGWRLVYPRITKAFSMVDIQFSCIALDSGHRGG